MLKKISSALLVLCMLVCAVPVSAADCAKHDYVAKADGTYVCANCAETVNAVSAPVLVYTTPVSVESGVVTVDVKVKAETAFFGTVFTVDVPDELTLVSVESKYENSNEWVFDSADALSTPYKVLLCKSSLEDAKLDDTVATLKFVVTDTFSAEDNIIDITVVEAYDSSENEIDTLAVDAELDVTDATPLTVSVSADAGYYAATADAAERTGAIAFNAEFEHYTEFEIESFGIYVYNANSVQKGHVASADADAFASNSGKFNVVVNNIPAEYFGSNVLAMPYVVINGVIINGDVCVFNVNNSLKWLGAK